MTAVSNTSPLCYLILIQCQELLPQFFDEVVIPLAVRDELAHLLSPEIVRDWIAKPPEWLHIQAITTMSDASLDVLHAGEREAILLAEQIRADFVLIDEQVAREMAKKRKLNVMGLIGMLDAAATRRLIDLTAAVKKLRATSFHVSPRILDELLHSHRS